jgi:hypothetical protein
VTIVMFVSRLDPHAQRRRPSIMRWILLAAVLSACATEAHDSDTEPERRERGSSRSEPTSAPSGKGVKPTLLGTRALGLGAATATLVDALAAHNRVESSHVGAAGSPSEVYAAYEKLAAQVTAEEARKLLMHENPAVRGYLAGHVLRKQPAAAAAVYPLLADPSPVGSTQGCDRGDTTVARHVAEELEAALSQSALGATAHAELGKLLLRAAGDTTLEVALRRATLRSAANHSATGVEALAKGLLADRDDELVAGALDALFLAGAPGTLADVEPFARHPNAGVRRAAAALLGHIDDVAAEALLTTLKGDRDKSVSRSAETALLRHRTRGTAAVLAAMGDATHGRAVIVGLQRLASPWAIALLVDHARAHTNHAWVLSGVRRTRDEAVLAPMRRVAVEPGEGEAFTKAREAAVRYLAAAGEPPTR